MVITVSVEVAWTRQVTVDLPELLHLANKQKQYTIEKQLVYITKPSLDEYNFKYLLLH
jgi:hypothetical protein